MALVDDNYFNVRLTHDPKRIDVWKAISEYLQSNIIHKNCQSILELGCGYGDFINTINVENKIAVDIADMSEYLNDNVSFYKKSVSELSEFDNNSVDCVFASNLLEHLERDECIKLCSEAYRILKPNGQILLLQPNFRLCYKRYFDDYTHKTIFTDESLKGMLMSQNFKIQYLKAGFLPFSMKNSLLPKSYFLTKLFLTLGSPLFGAQMLIAGEKNV
jgi:ubiquinone/menaquinone biosynthesis C-methylase UbiE